MRFSLLLPLFLLTIAVYGQGVTYHADVAPIIHENCTECHRAGEIGPMPFTTYEEVAAYGEFIEYVTSIGYMPPWTPDPEYQHFLGERSLSQEDVETLSAWVDAGKPEGNPAENPGLPVFPEGSQVGTPDLIIGMPEPYVHGGDNTEQYQVFVIPTDFEEDVAIRAVEVRTGNGAIAHHAILGIDISGTAQELDAASPGMGYESFGDFGFDAYENFFAGWAPGIEAVIHPEGLGRVIPAGSDLLLQMHYGPTGVEQSDQTELNLFFCDEEIEREVVTGIMGPWTIGEPFVIPPNQVKTFHGEYLIPTDLSLLNITPHSHLIGASWEVFATSPNGADTIPLISIPEWDFNWQGMFTFPTLTKVPAGYTMEAIASYDNTADNPFNPNDPPQTVYYGDLTGDEMFFVFFNFVPYQEGDENISMSSSTFSGITEDHAEEANFRLQPNPAGMRVQLLNDPALLGTLWSLSDPMGRVVDKGIFRSTSQLLNIESMSEGVYLFRCRAGIERLVIQH